jgi:hypothetical protein
MGAVLLFVKNHARDYHVNSHALLLFRVKLHVCVPRRAVGIHVVFFQHILVENCDWSAENAFRCTKCVCKKLRETTL